MSSKSNLRRTFVSIGRLLLLVALLTVVTFDGMLQTATSGATSLFLADFATTNKKATRTFCVSWEVNSDEWWTHNPEWEMAMGMDNFTHYCFQYIENATKRETFVQLYKTQFYGECGKTLTKKMQSSGWTSDFMNVIDGLKHALVHKRPVQIANTPWQYADPEKAKPGILAYKGIAPVCPQGNQFCYFLPLSSCPAAIETDPRDVLEGAFTQTPEYQWLYEYATRPQTWLRKEVYRFTKAQKPIATPCSVIHYQHGDAVLHPGNYKRKYHPIRDYMNSSFHLQKNILLLTDDQNAITEATTEYPDHNWMYVDQPRFKVDQGGFEMQLPSKNPIYEVVVLLSVFQMARQCSHLVHSHSGFATQLFAEMQASGNHRDLRRDKIDPGMVFSSKHTSSVSLSRAYDPDVVARDGY